MVKRKPHHSLASIQARFADPATLVITTSAIRSAADLGYDRARIVALVQALGTGDFVKSETAHNPSNPKVWHDSYRTTHGDLELYLKFAGEALIDLTLTSFKEA